MLLMRSFFSMELVLAGESRLDTTDLDRRKPKSRWQTGGPEKLYSEAADPPEFTAVKKS